MKIWAHFRRFAPETGLSAPIFFAGNGKKVFPLLSLARLHTAAFFAHKIALKTAAYPGIPRDPY
jgi:hypothetical protein